MRENLVIAQELREQAAIINELADRHPEDSGEHVVLKIVVTHLLFRAEHLERE